MNLNFTVIFLIIISCIVNHNMYAQNISKDPIQTKVVYKSANDSKDIDLGYKKISFSEYDSLRILNDVAKVTYQKMKSHSKLITEDIKSNSQIIAQLDKYKKIKLEYRSKNIEFNSLFIKLIIENKNIHYVYFTPEIGYLYTNIDFDVPELEKQLNYISMSPIKVSIK